MLRTRTAGSLRASDIGQVVTLTGWVDRRRDHGGVAFIDLRDASGIAQVVIREEIAHDLRAEYVLAVTGEVSARPEGNANPNLPTGEIEVVVSDVEILNASAPLPFQVSDHAEDAGQVGEEARLRYRYLDLRRSAMQHAIRLRAKVSQAARRVLDSLHPGGRPRLPGSGSTGTGLLVRPAAEPAAVQAAPHGRRHGALLPDRPLLPR